MFILFKSNFWLNSRSSVVNIPNIWKGGSGLSVPLYRLYVTLLRQLCTLGWHQASRLYSGPVCTWVKRPKTKFSKYFMKGHAGRPDLDLTTIMGFIFWPLAFCMGIPAKVFFRHHPFSNSPGWDIISFCFDDSVILNSSCNCFGSNPSFLLSF